MSITVSMAGGNTNVQNMNPMMGQMQMSSLQMPGMNTVCPEQVSGAAGTLAAHPSPQTTPQVIPPGKIRYVQLLIKNNHTTQKCVSVISQWH